MLPHFARSALFVLAVLCSLASPMLLAGNESVSTRRAAMPALPFVAVEQVGLLLPPDAPAGAPLRQALPDRAEETTGRGSRAIFFAFLCLSLIPILSLAVAFALKRRFDTLSRQRCASGKYRSPNRW
ncbi:MAG: hypothetical protein ACUVS4_04720 [Chloroflexaceae bacterium]